MKKKLISSFMLTGIIAFGAHAQDAAGSLYIKDATIAPGGSTTLSVQLENSKDIYAFQFEMILPDGVKYTDASMNEERLPNDINYTIVRPSQSDNTFKWYYSLTDNNNMPFAFTGTSGEIASITLSASPTLAEGEYTITLYKIDITSYYDGTTHDDDLEDTSFTLTVQAPSYDEGYAVEVLPFAFKEDMEVPLLMNYEAEIKSFSFDIIVPTFLINEELYEFSLNLSRFSTNIDDADGAIHVSSSSTRNKVDRTDFAKLNLYYEADHVEAGIYPITIKNIQLTDADGYTYLAAPYITEIFVGENPKIAVADGVAAFHGNYGGAEEFALLKAALPEGATIDLTETSALAEDPSTLLTDNVFVTNETVSYGRAMTTEWGTLCMPFAVKSTEGFQLYKLTKVSASEMTFDKAESAEANTPLVFKVSGEGFTVNATNDGTFVSTFSGSTLTITADAVENWAWNGSFVNETLDVSGKQAYALIDDEFHRITKTLNVKAFRAWLQNNGAPMNAAFRISDDTNSIEFVEQEDGSVKLMFDMQGRLQKDCAPGKMIIQNGQKKVISANN